MPEGHAEGAQTNFNRYKESHSLLSDLILVAWNKSNNSSKIKEATKIKLVIYFLIKWTFLFASMSTSAASGKEL